MRKVGTRRGVRALVLVGIVGLVTVGLAAQALGDIIIIVIPGARPVTGTSLLANPNSQIAATVGAGNPVAAGETVVVSVATGTFAGTVGCSDSEDNTYQLVADKNTGNGRLFVCSSRLTNPLTEGDTVRGSYPGFSGLSVISVIAISPFASTGTLTGGVSTSSGSNPPVSSGTIAVSGTGLSPFPLLVAVVAHSNISTFNPASGWTVVGAQSGGSGVGKRTVSPMFMIVPSGSYAATGSLSGSGFWQAAIVGYQGAFSGPV